MGSRNLPSPYRPGSFHFTRAFIWLSILIVTGIMIYFVVHLHSDGFKVPYAFLIILITCLLTLINLLFTTVLYARNSLRPIFSLSMNVILLILWIISLAFLGYSMRGTLMTTCNFDSWGTSTGVMVCRVYKTLFSFMFVATVFTFIHTVVDGVVKNDQRNLDVLAVYDSMNNNGGYGEDYKIHTRGESAVPLAAFPVHEESHVDPNAARADVFNALGTVRHDNTTLVQQQHQQQFQPQGHDVDYYDGVPDVPPAAGMRWASAAATRQTPYSPLHTRFEEQQTGYEAYRPHRTPYDEGGYGYRG
uniref:MARVEL domain-containing protein 2 n=1 Tax=Talaromyces marneffei PM1 TaxID=1077442 RepID=A0A093VJV4_TALMA